MEATLDISLYPLNSDYKQIIISFILYQKSQYPNLSIETNGMSTQVFGEYSQLMHFLTEAAKPLLQKYNAVFVIKIANGIQSPDNLPLELAK